VRLRLLINVFSFLILLVYLFTNLRVLMNEINSSHSGFKMDEITVPSIGVILPSESPIGDSEIWNLKKREKFQNAVSSNGSSVKGENFPGCAEYTTGKKGNVEFLKGPDGKEILFFGVVVKNRKRYAVFYDPSRPESKIFLLREGDLLGDKLKLKKIGRETLELLPVSCDKPQVVKLHIFYINIEEFQKREEGK